MILPQSDVKSFFTIVLLGNSAYRRYVRMVSILLHIFPQLQSHLTSQAEHQTMLRLG